jgi:hypothetical protein
MPLDDWRPGRWQQYKGRKASNGLFHGTGEQSGRVHCIIQVSGQAAHELAEWLFNVLPRESWSSLYCTRIDIQNTRTRPKFDDRPKVYKRLKDPKSLIQSSTGDTLYIGARTSDTYWRIYDKTTEYLRLELEAKGKQAKRIWMGLVAGENLGSVWNTYLHHSRVPKMYADYYRAKQEQAELPELTDDNPLGKKLEWLTQLDGLVYKLAQDDDTREDLGAILRRWTEYVQKFDNSV